MLELIVQEHNPSFKKLLPNVIAFSLDNILPILTDVRIILILSKTLVKF